MKRFLLFVVIIGILLAALGGAAVMGIYFWASEDLPNFKQIADYRPALATTVYARDGKVLGYFAHERRFLVTLGQMPAYVPHAFLAAEDSGFYKHEGVDPTAILRAFLANMRARGIRQGGSTITQQIIKQLLLTPERSYARKIKEAILAYRLEKHLTKDEILTIYLNQIYLGSGAYGVEAAARTYFGKHAAELTLAEAAMLAGLPQAPTSYNPYQHMEAAKTRQRYVLGRMVELGWVKDEGLEHATKEPIRLKSMTDPSWGVGAYYLEEVRRLLVEKFGEKTVYEGGLHVRTAIDLKHQALAEAALRKGLEEAAKRHGWAGPLERLKPADVAAFLAREKQPEQLTKGKWLKVVVDKVAPDGAQVRSGQWKGRIPMKEMAWARKLDPNRDPEKALPANPKDVLTVGDVVWGKLLETPQPDPASATLLLSLEREPGVEGALVSIRAEDGDVLAMVGGYSFQKSQFNRATQAKRQPGSSFKPIVYSAAMDNGFTPASVVLDAPVVLDDGSSELWRPENYEGKFYGPMVLCRALALSRNLVTVRVAQRIGIDKVVARARELGMEGDYPKVLSVALGSAVVSPMNLTEAYTAFARGGSYVRPRLVLDVVDPFGAQLFETPIDSVQAISPQNAFIMASMLKEVVIGGTGTGARIPGRFVAGKTGTTNDERDAWFVGFTPYLVTGVFVGFDSNVPMGRFEIGGKVAAPIFASYRSQVESEFPAQDFEKPAGVTMHQVAGAGTTYYMPFVDGTSPATSEGYAGVGEGGVSDPVGEDLFKQLQ